MSDDVQLTDLEVVQRYSLAVRAATAPRAELMAALESDLAWLAGSRPRTAAPTRRRPAVDTDASVSDGPSAAGKAAPRKAPGRTGRASVRAPEAGSARRSAGA